MCSMSSVKKLIWKNQSIFKMHNIPFILLTVSACSCQKCVVMPPACLVLFSRFPSGQGRMDVHVMLTPFSITRPFIFNFWATNRKILTNSSILDTNSQNSSRMQNYNYHQIRILGIRSARWNDSAPVSNRKKD